jgi:hypothetical protein
MFRSLLSHPQEELHKRHLVYCMRVMSVGYTNSTPILVQSADITRTQYTKCRLLAPPEDEKVVLETRRGP